MRRFALVITNWEWLILILLMPFLLFPTGWRGLLLFIVPILWLFRKIATGHFMPDTPYDSAIFLLLTAMLISLAAVFNIEYSFPKIAGLVIGVALFYCAVQYNRYVEGGEYHLLGVILIAGTGLSLVGLLSFSRSLEVGNVGSLLAMMPPQAYSLANMIGTEVNPNEIAGLLGWIIPLFAAVTFGFWGDMMRSGHWRLRLLHLVMLIFLLINSFVLIATRSRGGFVSVAAAILVMAAIRYRWGRWFLLFIVLAVVGIGLYIDIGSIIFSSSQGTTDLGLQGRFEIWSRALYALADFPFTGMGLNGFRQAVHLLYPLMIIPPTFDIGHAHNHLLQAGLDLGIPGLIAYLSIWIISGILLWIGWRSSKRQSDRVLIIGASGSLVAGFVFGIFDAIALGARPGFLWWLLIALLMATYENVQYYYPSD